MIFSPRPGQITHSIRELLRQDFSAFICIGLDPPTRVFPPFMTTGKQEMFPKMQCSDTAVRNYWPLQRVLAGMWVRITPGSPGPTSELTGQESASKRLLTRLSHGLFCATIWWVCAQWS